MTGDLNSTDAQFVSGGTTVSCGFRRDCIYHRLGEGRGWSLCPLCPSFLFQRLGEDPRFLGGSNDLFVRPHVHTSDPRSRGGVPPLCENGGLGRRLGPGSEVSPELRRDRFTTSFACLFTSGSRLLRTRTDSCRTSPPWSPPLLLCSFYDDTTLLRVYEQPSRLPESHRTRPQNSWE